MSDFDGEDYKSDAEYWAEYYARHPEPSNAFVRAAATGDIDTVRRMLGDGADVDQEDQGYPTEYGSMRDMREPNTLGATALEMAVRTRNLEMLKLLYEAGASPTRPARWGDGVDSVVSIAIHFGFVEGVRYLVDDQGLALKTEDETEAWMLVSAIGEQGSLEMLRYLVEEKGMSLDQKTENGISPASAANNRSGGPDFLEYIYSKGAVPSGTQHVWPKMKISFAEGVKEDIEVLTGDNFDSFEGMMKFMNRYTSHSTQLNESVFNADAEKVRVHLKYGADPLEKDDKGVDAYGVLARLMNSNSRVFTYREGHAEVERLLDEAVEARRKNTPKGPAPQ